MNSIASVVDEFNSSPAYHAGRLLALCQHIQDLTAPDVGRSYVDSYFASACTNPQIIASRVWKTARTRLRQIERLDTRKDIDDLATRIVNSFGSSWPGRLSPQDQSLFQLGYFHQRANLPIPDSRRRLLTMRGISVRSNGEKLIADILDRSGFDNHLYEEPLTVPDKKRESGVAVIKPDFTVRSSKNGRCLYIELCGMLGIESYDRQWNYKRGRYAELGARTLEDVRTDGRITEHTLMQVTSDDIRDTKRFFHELRNAVTLVTGEDCSALAEETPF